MTRDEILTLADFRKEVQGEFEKVRQELAESRKDLRTEFAPALDFYRLVNSLGRALKWGAGIGAGGVTIAAGLRALNIL